MAPGVLGEAGSSHLKVRYLAPGAIRLSVFCVLVTESLVICCDDIRKLMSTLGLLRNLASLLEMSIGCAEVVSVQCSPSRLLCGGPEL